jgi:hypothetical protein
VAETALCDLCREGYAASDKPNFEKHTVAAEVERKKRAREEKEE